METKYNESEKIWSAPEISSNYCGLGQAILAKLKEDDQHRVIEFFYDKKHQLTVGDIRRQTITVAQNFQRIGIKKGDTVVLYSLSNDKITPITFACYAIGAPVNFFNIKLEGGDIEEFLLKIDPKLIIFEENYRSQLFSALESINLTNLKYVLSLGNITPSVNELLFQESSDIDNFQAPDIEDPTTHPATLIFTSGSTGLPKIIMHSHTFMLQGIEHSRLHVEPGDKMFSFGRLPGISQIKMMIQPVFFDIQRIYTSTSQSPSATLGKHIIDTYKVTHFVSVPAPYLALLSLAESSTDTFSLNSLKMALLNGEIISNALISLSSKVIPHCKVFKCYGLTETACLVSSVEDISGGGGILHNGFMVKIIDDDNNLLGPNQMGQLCIKKKVPYLQYLKNDKANEKNFLKGGWLNTGDYAFMDSKNLLHIVGRYKHLFRSGGHIIIPTELEDIVGSHQSVLESVLVGHPSPENPTDEIGTVFVVLRDGKTSKYIEDELRELIKRKCTKEQENAVRHIKVIEKMPLISCGKVDRRTLKDMACKV